MSRRAGRDHDAQGECLDIGSIGTQAALRRGRVWWGVGVLVVVTGIVAYAILLEQGVLDGCRVAVHSSISAPDGRTSAVVFEMECGATVPFNTQVSLAPAGKPFSPKKNPAFLVLSGQHELVVRWGGEKVIEIDIPQEARVFRSERSVGDITIEYK